VPEDPLRGEGVGEELGLLFELGAWDGYHGAGVLVGRLRGRGRDVAAAGGGF
jgi:hypothetical protein